MRLASPPGRCLYFTAPAGGKEGFLAQQTEDREAQPMRSHRHPELFPPMNFYLEEPLPTPPFLCKSKPPTLFADGPPQFAFPELQLLWLFPSKLILLVS